MMAHEIMVERRRRDRAENERVIVGVGWRLWSLLAYSPTAPTRFMLALAASFWAALLYMPGDTFARPVYRLMAELAGDHAEMKWAALWTAHAVGMWWRLVAKKPRPYTAFCVNSLGVLLFSGAAYSIFFVMTFPIPAAIAPDVVLALAAFWVMVRTSVNSEEGWRGD